MLLFFLLDPPSPYLTKNIQCNINFSINKYIGDFFYTTTLAIQSYKGRHIINLILRRGRWEKGMKKR